MKLCFQIVAVLVAAFVVSLNASTVEQPSVDAKTTAATTAARETYSDDSAGFTVLIPTGFRKLTADETRDVFNGLSKYLGKEMGERTRKRAPAWFIGPANPKDSSEHPPSFAIAVTENAEPIDPSQMPAYKAMLEENFKREGEKIGNVALSIVNVDGIVSLQEEHSALNPINNETSRLIHVAVPGKGKWFELIFNYSPNQDERVRAALKEVLDSFKVVEHTQANDENARKWLRIACYTVGFGLVGAVLSVIWQRLTRRK